VRPRAIPHLFAATLAAIALIAASCGDDDDDTTKADSADFTERADALCRTAETEAVKIDPPGNPAQTADYASRSHAILVELRDGLAGLEPPADLSDSYERYLSSLDDDVSAMEALGAAAESGDQAEIQRIFNTEINEDSGQIAVNDLGLEGCGAAANAIAKTP
jgi:hypothetical protein